MPSSSATSAAGQAEHLAQDQDGPLVGRQQLQRRDERQPHGVAELGDLGRVGAAEGTTRASGTGCSHTASGIGAGSPSAAGRAGPMSIGRARRCRPVEHVEADVGRDLVQPRAQRRAPLGTARRPFQARTSVSCTASSASKADPSIQVAVARSSRRCSSNRCSSSVGARATDVSAITPIVRTTPRDSGNKCLARAWHRLPTYMSKPGRAFPVSSSVLRSLRTKGKPPPHLRSRRS